MGIIRLKAARMLVLCISASAGLLLTGAPPAHGTTVLQKDINEMLVGSALVFEGYVVEVESQLDSSDRLIHTYVTFELLEVLKGSWSQPTIELSFLGGTVGSRTVTVSGMQLPTLGQRGIYFVEAPARRQLNPFYGWSQGYLPVVRSADGALRVTTAAGAPIIDIDSSRRVPRAVQSTGVAAGLIARSDAPRITAMTVAEVKQSLRRLLRAQSR
jgi:hypothetical protein